RTASTLCHWLRRLRKLLHQLDASKVKLSAWRLRRPIGPIDDPIEPLVMPCARFLPQHSTDEYSSTDPQGHLPQFQCRRQPELATNSHWTNQRSDKVAGPCPRLSNAFQQ